MEIHPDGTYDASETELQAIAYGEKRPTLVEVYKRVPWLVQNTKFLVETIKSGIPLEVVYRTEADRLDALDFMENRLEVLVSMEADIFVHETTLMLENGE